MSKALSRWYGGIEWIAMTVKTQAHIMARLYTATGHTPTDRASHGCGLAIPESADEPRLFET